MKDFVHKDSIVRRIWGRGDCILLIFAGGAAEFALNKAVDWLYFTGRLPADPLGRLFSTVTYAQRIVFADQDRAMAAIDQISAIHRGVEQHRGQPIPPEAYLDVLFMLIDYSIRAFELLERPMTIEERAEVFSVFFQVGSRMGLRDLPADYPAYAAMRKQYMEKDLVAGHFSFDLYRQYRKHLGFLRYQSLLQIQGMLVPARVRGLLRLPSVPWIVPAILLYKGLHRLRLDRLVKDIILPHAYKARIYRLDRAG
ncbi:MAG: oxygenase MpaB family protein [Bacteroidota bacterium]|nr:oxygenase MpaB family protein [Bacteroidota bacterium]MDP4217418.1 oxygenase MpaB family protein [Bacteroidota bacterium]MDP4255384.1 oxygenase MpaB family protein [Bacteroidota bacterium]MDP4257263.1 oxygenase MpaB family protein [Bacteroidota bacterium]